MDTVLPCKIFILISFQEKLFTQMYSLQMSMNFDTFLSSFSVVCAIQINVNFDTVDKGWKLLYCKRYQSCVNST